MKSIPSPIESNKHPTKRPSIRQLQDVSIHIFSPSISQSEKEAYSPPSAPVSIRGMDDGGVGLSLEHSSFPACANFNGILLADELNQIFLLRYIGSIFAPRSALRRPSLVAVNARSGSTRMRWMRSRMPTLVKPSKNSSRMALLSESPSLCTPVPVPVNSPLPAELDDTVAWVSVRVPRTLVCLGMLSSYSCKTCMEETREGKQRCWNDSTGSSFHTLGYFPLLNIFFSLQNRDRKSVV